jgi:putative transcriptional regulator
MKKQYRSRIRASIHETVQDLHDAGVVDKRTLRQFDEVCLRPVRQLNSDKIRKIREL